MMSYQLEKKADFLKPFERKIMTTVAEILAKIANKTAVKADFDQLAKLYEAEAEQEKKAEEVFNKLIDTISKAKIDPAKLYAALAEKELISAPKTSAKSDKVVLVEEPIKTKEGRDSTFKIWGGRDLNALQGEAKKNWLALKAKGKDYFMTRFTEEGKKYNEAFGTAWVEALFK